jgi:hypothetical protein
MTNRERILADTKLAAQIAASLLSTGQYTIHDERAPPRLYESCDGLRGGPRPLVVIHALEIVDALRDEEKVTLSVEDDLDGEWMRAR